MRLTLDITTEQEELLNTLLRRHLPDVEVWAYGSRVRGNARPYSDLDLVVFAPPSSHVRQVADFRESLEESNLAFPVDVLIWDELPESFHRNIEADHVVVQESNDPEFAHQMGRDEVVMRGDRDGSHKLAK
jgi:predicted nucleotidyltransferase